MQKSWSKQRGMTTGGLILLLALIGFFALIAIKVTPLYMDNYAVAGAFKSLKEAPDLANMSESQIRSKLGKLFQIGYVDFIQEKDVQITSIPGYVKVGINYERVVPVIGNASVLLTFDESIEVGSK